MVSRRGNTTHRKIGKVRKARAVVMVLLVMVALAIVLIDKKEDVEAIELSQNEPQSSLDKTSAATTADSIFAIPSHNSIAQNVDSSKPNLVKNSVVIGQSQPFTSVQEIARPKADAQVEKNNEKTPAAQPDRSIAQNDSRQPKTDGKLPSVHCVASGETLTAIASKYYGKTIFWEAIYNANRDVLRSPRSLKPGQEIKIPAGTSIVYSSPKRKSMSPKSRANYRGECLGTKSGDAIYVADKTDKGLFHVVARGETLSRIAKKNNIGFLALLDINKDIVKNPNRIREGTKIWIPNAR